MRVKIGKKVQMKLIRYKNRINRYYKGKAIQIQRKQLFDDFKSMIIKGHIGQTVRLSVRQIPCSTDLKKSFIGASTQNFFKVLGTR